MSKGREEERRYKKSEGREEERRYKKSKGREKREDIRRVREDGPYYVYHCNSDI